MAEEGVEGHEIRVSLTALLLSDCDRIYEAGMFFPWAVWRRCLQVAARPI